MDEETQDRSDYVSPFKKPPFRRKYEVDDTRNPNKDRDIFTISLNKEERRMIDLYRHVWQCGGDSTVLKALARIGANVLRASFDEETLRWLASPKRVRETIAMPKSEQNVTPDSQKKAV